MSAWSIFREIRRVTAPQRPLRRLNRPRARAEQSARSTGRDRPQAVLARSPPGCSKAVVASRANLLRATHAVSRFGFMSGRLANELTQPVARSPDYSRAGGALGINMKLLSNDEGAVHGYRARCSRLQASRDAVKQHYPNLPNRIS